MNFTTILIGNGIGRAIDNDYFKLSAGIDQVWDSANDPVITQSFKTQILNCLPLTNNQVPTIPTSENDLENIHWIENACSTISNLGRNPRTWLTSNGSTIQDKLNYFIGSIANYFHQYNDPYPQNYCDFIDSLSNYISRYCCHLATLNYDNLLYQPLIDNGILQGYDGDLIDGFTGGGFKPDNLDRHSASKGWYLHLHGSPLFYDRNNKTYKLRQPDLSSSFENGQMLKRHLVLHHTKQKPDVITGSPILSEYWRRFDKGLRESVSVVIIGYGGGDSHINDQISGWVKLGEVFGIQRELIVIERQSSQHSFIRKRFWKSRLDPENSLTQQEFKLIRISNILDFDWENDLP